MTLPVTTLSATTHRLKSTAGLESAIMKQSRRTGVSSEPPCKLSCSASPGLDPNNEDPGKERFMFTSGLELVAFPLMKTTDPKLSCTTIGPETARLMDAPEFVAVPFINITGPGFLHVCHRGTGRCGGRNDGSRAQEPRQSLK
jgi:hypothetical protein